MPITIDELLVEVAPPPAATPAEAPAAQDETAREREFGAMLAERARVASRRVAD